MKKNKPSPTEPLLSREEIKELHFAVYAASDDDAVRSSIAIALLKLHYADDSDQKESSK